MDIILLMADPEGGSPFASFIFLGLIFFIFWLFIIRPQSKKQKEIQQKVTEMKKGDKIVTSGGMLGILHSNDEETVLIEVDKEVKIRVLKNAIVDVNPNKKA
ncbi:MAG: preprotein translocase subunit YajC [Candidatus Cyclonatronum sp.]|uniref:preprotein translocase subunit YajC n=1 Tax=Cyclonatronum sp. TaxID=3024185 RepID=UPI0025C340E5|nr:preprotein translocase subunit YajC [Cyclonatronum sp.]MCC5933938.1 preprotein translocase subunit YajC [Balneolales bacterium]MCH8486403.1 preprotein translocase subunit YajC [Cyclonatronum sp.]